MDIEKGVICSVLRRGDPAALYDAVTLGLDAEMFKGPAKDVWVFMLQYAQEHSGLVPANVVEDMFPEFQLPPDDVKTAVPSFYIDQIKQRNLGHAIQQSMKAASELIVGKEPVEAFEELERMIAEAQVDARSALEVNLAEVGDTLVDRYDAIRESDGIEGFNTPWPCLTRATLGWKRGELIVVSARPGTGKSWFAVLLADAVHTLDKKVPLIVSREMSVEQFLRRIAAQKAKVPHMGFRAGDLSTAQYERFTQMAAGLKDEHPYWISGNDAALGVQGLSAKIDRLKPDIVIIDGLYLMRDDRGHQSHAGHQAARDA